MTGRGSVTPGMACGSRPVESGPERGAFPTVGINQRPGIAKGEAFSPLARPRQRPVGKSPQQTGRKRTNKIKLLRVLRTLRWTVRGKRWASQAQQPTYLTSDSSYRRYQRRSCLWPDRRNPASSVGPRGGGS
jgi:hypothetical protein